MHPKGICAEWHPIFQVQARVLTLVAPLLSLPVGQVSHLLRQKQQALCTLLKVQSPIPVAVLSHQGKGT